MPIYRVKQENGKVRERTLHHNNIYPLLWPFNKSAKETVLAVNKEKGGGASQTHSVHEHEESESNSDSEDCSAGDLVIKITRPVEGNLTPVRPVEKTDGMTSEAIQNAEAQDVLLESQQDGVMGQHDAEYQVEEFDETRSEETAQLVADDCVGEVAEVGEVGGSQETEEFQAVIPEGEPMVQLSQFPSREKEVQEGRPVRTRRPPDRYGDCVSYQQTVVQDNWEARAQYLLGLIAIFPEKRERIFETVLWIAVHK